MSLFLGENREIIFGVMGTVMTFHIGEPPFQEILLWSSLGGYHVFDVILCSSRHPRSKSTKKYESPEMIS